uniref:Ribosomal protein S20 n=1 Tax=Chondria tumulosa TaxID=2740715 RepID=A0A896SQJ9_9FLOR|nr:ribosomal protein S20 [Chondria tumulosa]QSD57106.1 ribosomal protein S20 [Chondria tumulosa]
MSSNIKNNQIILRNRNHNKRYKFAIKKAIKKYLISLTNNREKFKTQIQYSKLNESNLSLVYQKIDKAVKKKVIHKNTAARKKAKLAKMLKY